MYLWVQQSRLKTKKLGNSQGKVFMAPSHFLMYYYLNSLDSLRHLVKMLVHEFFFNGPSKGRWRWAAQHQSTDNRYMWTFPLETRLSINELSTCASPWGFND